MILQPQAEPAPLTIDPQGVALIAGTRVTLDTVVQLYWQGASAEGIVEDIPTLNLGDVYAVIGYYLRHRDVVDAYLNRRSLEIAELRAKVESQFDPTGLRERLLARRGNPDRSSSP